MKHPNKIQDQLVRQWNNPETRERRLLDSGEWPMEIMIGKPSVRVVTMQPSILRDHLTSWKDISVGRVEWSKESYRDASAPITVPKSWILSSPSEWIDACCDEELKLEFSNLGSIVEKVDPVFYSVLIRQRSQVMAKSAEEVILSTKVAMALEPSCANGQPLRMLSIEGCDSKFFERNRRLVTQLLIVRYGESVNEQGLEGFLDALDENDHWLLIAPLGRDLLPFKQQRVRARELFEGPLGAGHILIVENEKCVYQLPHLSDTIAILGAGQNLKWLSANWLKKKHVAYWGDIDTWGLSMLSAARQQLPNLVPLMMDKNIYDTYGPLSAVIEPETAGSTPPTDLTAEEANLYAYLCGQKKGRLEQEFLPVDCVKKCIESWVLEY